MFWWLKLGYKDRWTPDSVIKFIRELNNKLIHEEEDSNIYAGSLITSCKPKCPEIFAIPLHSVVILSFQHQLLDIPLKSPRITIKKGLFWTGAQDLAQNFIKDSNWSYDWLGDLYNAMKLLSLSPTISSNSHLNNQYRYRQFLKANNSCSIIEIFLSLW